MRLETAGITCTFDPQSGQIEAFTVTDGGRAVAPLHRAPWIGEPLPPGTPPHLARLGGDWFCAPFAASEDGPVGPSPMHGWTANAPWDVAERGPATLTAHLSRPVMGARVTKTLRLEPGHPFVYQRHDLEGGAGSLTVANHANVAVPHGAHIRTSPKAAWRTPPEALEPDPARGRSRLRYPAEGTLAAFPGRDGPVDLRRYPWGPAHEDLVAGLEAPGMDGRALGWTAVARPCQGDLFLSLRDPARLPMTMLWHSNGGRDYPPWSGRHHGCLGVEEGAAAAVLGSEGSPFADPGALALGGVQTVRHVTGAIAWPTGAPVAAVEVEGRALHVRGEDGTSRSVPVDPVGVWGS